jgi:hypothetical protein
MTAEPQPGAARSAGSHHTHTVQGVVGTCHYGLIDVQEQVRILRYDASNSNDVAYDLDVVDLQWLGLNAFFALSYCWGIGEQDASVQISGSAFGVTSNLFLGLQAVRRYAFARKMPDYYVWVDAICINQSDQAEKSAQVQHMSRIYHHASEVLIWLGEASNNSSMVMKMLRWLGRPPGRKVEVVPGAGAKGDEAYRALPRNQSPQSQLEETQLCELGRILYMVKTSWDRYEMDQETIQSLRANIISHGNLVPPEHVFWRQWGDLFGRPWFSRLWTLQEIELARNAIALCGEEAVDWSIVHCWRSVAYAEHWQHHLYPWESLHVERISRPLRRSGMSGIDTPIVPRQDLFRGVATLRALLLDKSTRHAHDPRDFVYGLIGLLGEDARPAIQSEYGVSPAEVYKRTLCLLCQGIEGPSYWCQVMETYAEVQQGWVTDTPSWCPDFSKRSRAFSSVPFRGNANFPAKFREVTRVFHRLTFTPNGLELAGVLVDVVESSVGTAPDFDVPSGHQGTQHIRDCILNTHHHQWLDDIVRLLGEKSAEPSSMLDRWLDKFFYQEARIPVEQQRIRFNNLRSFCRIVQSAGSCSVCSLLRATRSPGFNPSLAGDMLDDALEAFAWNHGRFFFITGSGKIGFSPLPTRPGDNICFIGGANYMHVLSRECDEWITYASVEGMVGAAVLDRVRDVNVWQSFRLR